MIGLDDGCYSVDDYVACRQICYRVSRYMKEGQGGFAL